MTSPPAEQREVWLRANVRPVAGVGVALGLVALVGALVSGTVGKVLAVAWAITGCGILGMAILAAVGRVAARPRLVRVGDAIELRLTPTSVERVPLAVVECIFRGTEPVGDGAGEPRFRVGTLVVRFAERAAEWRSRPTFRPWGDWNDGHAVIDGRWCEPLTRETVERIAAALLEAKQQVVRGSDA